MSWPHVRLYRPDGTFEAFGRPVSKAEMERIAGMPLTIQYAASLDRCYSEAMQAAIGPVSCHYGRTDWKGPLFLGHYDGTAMLPADPRFFEAVGDDFKYDIINWNA